MAAPNYPSNASPNSDGEDDHATRTITIEEELGQWAPNTNARVAETIHAAQQDRSGQERSRNQHRKRLRVAVLASVIMLLVALGVVWWFSRKTPSLQATSQPTATPLKPVDSLQISDLKAGKSEQTPSVTETEMTLSQQGQDVLKVVKLEFVASKFLVDNTVLKNQDELIQDFKSRRGGFDGGWALIFAAASLEGLKDHNLCLCTRRLAAVRQLMVKDAELKANSYWGILAGEYKTDLPGVKPGGEEDAEEVLAAKLSEDELSDQRRLIVVGIKEVVPLEPQAAEHVPFVVAKLLYDNNMLPQNYDSAGSKPFLIKQTVSAEDDCGSRGNRKGRSNNK